MDRSSPGSALGKSGLWRDGLILALSVLSMLLPLRCFAATCSVADLHWLEGVWRDASEPMRTEERWVSAPGEVLMGSAWSFYPSGAGYAEAGTIFRDGDNLVLRTRHFDAKFNRAWEERDAPLVFIAASCGERSIAFVGDASHPDEKLSYQRDGSRLLVIGDFVHHGKPDHEEFRFVLYSGQ